MRDLLLDPEPYDPTRRQVMGTWESVFDIPPDTLVRTTGSPAVLLYITSSGKGWWIGSQPSVWSGTIRGAKMNGGWPLAANHQTFGPFTEVPEERWPT